MKYIDKDTVQFPNGVCAKIYLAKEHGSKDGVSTITFYKKEKLMEMHKVYFIIFFNLIKGNHDLEGYKLRITTSAEIPNKAYFVMMVKIIEEMFPHCTEIYQLIYHHYHNYWHYKRKLHKFGFIETIDINDPKEHLSYDLFIYYLKQQWQP